MQKPILTFIKIISVLLIGLCVSCTKESEKDTESTNKIETSVASQFNPVEINFSTQVVKNIKPTITKAKAPQLVFEDKNLVQGQGNKIAFNKDALRTVALKELPTKIIIPTLVKAKPPIVIKALPYKTRENNPFNIKYLDIEQGLKNATIYTIVEDADGAIWFGSRLGLTKYDGEKLYHYSENEGLIFNQIKTLTIDHSGNLWIGTIGGGLSKFDGRIFTNYNLDAGLPSNTINTIFEDTKNQIWCGTEGGGTFKLKDSLIYFFNENNDFPPSVSSILELENGGILLSSVDNGVFIINDKKVSCLKKENGLVDNSIVSSFKDNFNNIWFGGDKEGLSKLTKDGFINYNATNGLLSNELYAIKQDKKNNYWFGTLSNGISKFDGLNFQHFTIEQGLNNNAIKSICCTKNNDVWVGTEGSGIAKISSDVFSHKTVKEGLSNNWVWAITQDLNKELVVATNEGGITKKSNNAYYGYTTIEGLNDDVVVSLYNNKDGSYWFGSYVNGACYFDGNEFKTISTKQGLLDNTVWTIAKDHQNNLWLGTENGISKYDGVNITNYYNHNSTNHVTIYSSFVDKENTIWFGTKDLGLLQYKNNKFYNITKEQGLIDNVISCIAQDSSGNLWFGSQNGGVSRLKNNEFTNLKEKNGLTSSAVLSMVCDDKGNMWFGTRAGINKLPQSKVNLSKQELESSSNLFKTYGINEGFTGLNCVRNSVFLDKDNFIWWGTTKMLTKYNPNADYIDSIAPKVLINNIKLLSEDVNWNNILINDKSDTTLVNHRGIKLKSTTAWNNLPVDLVLPYDQNHLTFEFIGIDFNSQGKINYQYMLEGADENWSPVITTTEADYRNIEPGNYTFKLKSGNKDGYWSDPLEFKFTVNPPWWKTWWALTMWVIGIILLIYNYIKYRERVLKMRQQELEETVEDRTKEVVSQKEIVEKKQTEILDSINYAKRIQHSLLASNKLLDAYLKENSQEKNTASDYFIVFKPKDIVSGDFYWASKLSDDNFVILTADSTGHGVPGAIMSILNIACLKEAISKGNTRPDLLLNETRRLVIENLNNDGSAEGGKDGMDGSLLSFDFKNQTMYCASANNPIWIIRDGALIEIKADRMPIGKHDKDKTPFTMNTFSIQKGDLVYTLTDGFPDQFGGADGKKFKSKQLQSFLLSIANEPMAIQQQKLNHAFDTWRGDLDQVDDVCLIGVKI